MSTTGTHAIAPGNPLVSVVVAAYRHERYIQRCLESIVEQTYPRIEVIVVDDNSPDQTLQVAERVLARKHRNVERSHVVRNTVNRGAHFTLTRGMTAARGAYVSLMNSDDTYDPARLATMIEALQAAGAEWGFSRVATIDDNDRQYYDEPLCHHIHWRAKLAVETLPSVSWGLLRYQLTASTGNLVMSTKLARRVGGFANLKYCHDWDFVLRAAYLAEPIFVDPPLYNYRIHGTNSFRALDEVAGIETQYCLRGYFRRAMSNRPVNPLAPSPANWPALFEPLLRRLGVKHHLDAVYSPYRDYHRTVDHKAA